MAVVLAAAGGAVPFAYNAVIAQGAGCVRERPEQVFAIARAEGESPCFVQRVGESVLTLRLNLAVLYFEASWFART